MISKQVQEVFEELREHAFRVTHGHCYVRSIKMAKALVQVGYPEILTVVARGIPREMFPSTIPKKWDIHYICIDRGIVYDPSAGLPLPEKAYIPFMFPHQNILLTPRSDSAKIISQPISQKLEDAYHGRIYA